MRIRKIAKKAIGVVAALYILALILVPLYMYNVYAFLTFLACVGFGVALSLVMWAFPPKNDNDASI
jgi:hypothetical protein